MVVEKKCFAAFRNNHINTLNCLGIIVKNIASVILAYMLAARAGCLYKYC